MTDQAEKPQIYVYLTSGGILEYIVTRGDIDVIDVDWDENMDRTVEDWREIVTKLSGLADSELRNREIASASEEIDELIACEEDEREQEARARQRDIEAARAILKEAGELSDEYITEMVHDQP